MHKENHTKREIQDKREFEVWEGLRPDNLDAKLPFKYAHNRNEAQAVPELS